MNRPIYIGFARRGVVIAVLAMLPILPMIESASAPRGIEIEASPDGWRVSMGGELFAEFRTGADHQKPFFYPVNAPGGVGVTRGWPMIDGLEGEAHDHPHHVSLWFAHGDVNGHDFWHGPKGERIVHIESTKAGINGDSDLMSTLEWRGPDATPIIIEKRRVRFIEDPSSCTRIMQFDIELSSAGGDVTFGDTKEGTFALRLAPTLRLSGDVAQGKVMNSEGVSGEDVWGKRAGWVAYSGPVQGKVVTVAIFDHPENLRHPTWWHARDYGLVAANPFGIHDFEGKQRGAGDYILRTGDTLIIHYQIVIAEGDLSAAALSEMAAAWSVKRRSPSSP